MTDLLTAALYVLCLAPLAIIILFAVGVLR